MSEPHRDTGTQMRRLHPSPTGPHPYPWTQPIQHQGTSIVSQAGARTRPILHMPRRPRARRLRQTQGALRKTKHNRGSLSIRANRTHRHATQSERPEVRTRIVQTMPRRENRQNKTSRLQYQTVKTISSRTSPQKRPATPRGVGYRPPLPGPPESCLSGAQGSNIAGGPPRGRSRRSVARAQGHDER